LFAGAVFRCVLLPVLAGTVPLLAGGHGPGEWCLSERELQNLKVYSAAAACPNPKLQELDVGIVVSDVAMLIVLMKGVSGRNRNGIVSIDH
jgi:hypothetical protein